jgi:hypothetical protein
MESLPFGRMSFSGIGGILLEQAALSIRIGHLRVIGRYEPFAIQLIQRKFCSLEDDMHQLQGWLCRHRIIASSSAPFGAGLVRTWERRATDRKSKPP